MELGGPEYTSLRHHGTRYIVRLDAAMVSLV